jgi:putative ABC transport system permease protein
MIADLWQDLRFGARMLLKQPGFTLIAVLTLALGIGANTAIFSIVNAVLLRPLPYQQPDRLVAVWESDKRKVEGQSSMAYPNFYDLRAQNQSFEQMASYYTNNVVLTGIATPVNLRSAIVSAELFTLLSNQPERGRWFLPEEGKPGSSTGRAVMISHGLWQRLFSGDLNIIGRSVMLDGKPYNVVGVMPAGFQFPIEPNPIEIWLTSAIDGEKSDPQDAAQDEQRGSHFINVIGRLKPKVSLAQAQADVSLIAAKLENQFPDTNTQRGIKLIPYHNNLVADYHTALWIILGAVGCVLLIACANVANLLLARATTRYKEIAVRVALGANRWRIVRQLLTESLALSLIGGVLGLLLAWWGTAALVRLIPEDLPRLSEIGMNYRVFGFTLLMSAVTGIVFGLAPALQASKIELTEALKEGGRAGGSSGRARLRNSLVVAEIAVAMILLVSAGLLLKTFRKLQQVDLGFNPSQVLTASVEIPGARYPQPEQSAAFYKTLVEKLKALPGVESASAIAPQPLSGDTFVIPFEVEGRSFPKGTRPSAHFRAIGADYFNTMKISLVAGRDFTPRDDEKSPPVIIVNEAFAQKHFPGESPLGKHVKPGTAIEGEPQWRAIVGVVKNVKHRQALRRDYEPEYYFPHAQMPLGSMNLVIRTKNDPTGLVAVIQREVNLLDKDVPVYRTKTLDQYLGVAVAQPKFNTLLLTLFAGLALLLTAVGLYGVIAYSVAQRTQEIGVRLTLGAQTSDVVKLVLRQGLLLTALGLVIGVGAAFALTRLMTELLYGVTPTDPLTYTVIALLLTLVALLACWIPARRAAKVDPLVALRCD